MSVPPPSWMPNSTSTGSPSSSVRSTTAVSNAITRVLERGQRGERGAEHARVDDRRRHAPALVEREDQLGGERAPPARVPDQPLGDDRAVLGLVVAQVGADRAVPVDLGGPRARACARCGPARRGRRRACGRRAAARCPRPPRARRRRATCRLASGSASRRLISVAARCTSGVTDSSTSGSSSSRCSPSRSIASCCTTRTTPVGKCARSSPSQRATRRRRLAQPAPPLAVDRVQRAVDRRGPRARAPRPSPRPRPRRARAASAAAAPRSRLAPQQPSRRSPAPGARALGVHDGLTLRGLSPLACRGGARRGGGARRRAGRRRRGAGAGGRS